MKMPIAPTAALALLAACTSPQKPAEPPAGEDPRSEPLPMPSPSAQDDGNEPDIPAPAPTPSVAAAQLLRAEWAKAENRDRCAPIGFAIERDARATARRASFAGGWAVSFDRPDLRSAYGVAGTGSPAATMAELYNHWPYAWHPPSLPAGSLAAYGIEGAGGYPPGNREGYNVNSLAYVLVEGQGCLYNVWSRLGRAHLEMLLNGLQLVD